MTRVEVLPRCSHAESTETNGGDRQHQHAGHEPRHPQPLVEPTQHFYPAAHPLGQFGLYHHDLVGSYTSREIRLFRLSIGVFFTAYIGLGISLWPFAIPFAITFRQAAAAPASQSLLLVGTVILLPLVLGYTAYCYYLFRGKASHETAY